MTNRLITATYDGTDRKNAVAQHAGVARSALEQKKAERARRTARLAQTRPCEIANRD